MFRFLPDGAFWAPDGHCNDGTSCTWSRERGGIGVQWGGAGPHKARISKDRRRLSGRRLMDNDAFQATFVRRLSDEEVAATPGGGPKEPEEDMYEVLGVDEDADDNAIKKAFRKLSRQYHPDKARGADREEAQKMFDKIRNAYEVVGDPDKRALYDTGGIEAVRDAEKKDASGGGGMNPLAAFFGGQMGGGGGKKRKANKGPDFKMEHPCTLESMYNGSDLKVEIRRRVVCRGCNRKEKRKTAKCRACGRCPNEIRTVMRSMGIMQIQQQEEVPSKHKCKTEPKTLDLTVEKGMADGAEITFERASEQRPGQIPGDVVVVLREKKHGRFRREGNDLHTELDVSLLEALVGFEKSVRHLDGHEVSVRQWDRPSRPFEVHKIQGEGMPVHEFPSQFGDLYVKINIIMPDKIDEEQAAWLRSNLPNTPYTKMATA